MAEIDLLRHYRRSKRKMDKQRSIQPAAKGIALFGEACCKRGLFLDNSRPEPGVDRFLVQT